MVEEDFVGMARRLIDKAEAKGVKLLLPTDVVVADKFAADAATQTVRAHSLCSLFLYLCRWCASTVAVLFSFPQIFAHRSRSGFRR